jgi:hypothetical protein
LADHTRAVKVTEACEDVLRPFDYPVDEYLNMQASAATPLPQSKPSEPVFIDWEALSDERRRLKRAQSTKLYERFVVTNGATSKNGLYDKLGRVLNALSKSLTEASAAPPPFKIVVLGGSMTTSSFSGRRKVQWRYPQMLQVLATAVAALAGGLERIRLPGYPAAPHAPCERGVARLVSTRLRVVDRGLVHRRTYQRR